MEQFLVVDPSWEQADVGSIAGLLVMREVSNPPAQPAISQLAADLEEGLRRQFAGQDRAAIQAIPPLPAYAAFYKRFGQRYHVGMQLESIALKGRLVPRVAALVEAMFIAELRHGILTAGHDLDALSRPVTLGVGTGTEAFTRANGEVTAVKAGDLYTATPEGVLSAIISGPSALARISPATTAALFVIYAPPGVEQARVDAHLDEIEANVRLIAPGAATSERIVTIATGAM